MFGYNFNVVKWDGVMADEMRECFGWFISRFLLCASTGAQLIFLHKKTKQKDRQIIRQTNKQRNDGDNFS